MFLLAVRCRPCYGLALLPLLDGQGLRRDGRSCAQGCRWPAGGPSGGGGYQSPHRRRRPVLVAGGQTQGERSIVAILAHGGFIVFVLGRVDLGPISTE